MGISEILHKNNPMQKKTDRENRSDFAKLVDRNTELVDENKWLKADNDILKGRIDKAIECIYYYGIQNEDYDYIFDDEEKELLEILKGENYD